jgi:hypothetical protein
MGQRSRHSPGLLRAVLLAQAACFMASGLRANVHRRSFEAVAGPKQDNWLARIVGLLVLLIGGTLAAGSRRNRPAGEILGLAASSAAGSAAGLGAIEAHYAVRRRISLMYLLDAVIETLFVIRVVLGWRRSRHEASAS